MSTSRRSVQLTISANEWRNYENGSYYDQSPEGMLDIHAERSGIAKGEDVLQILPLLRKLAIDDRTRILEIGAGTGRVIDQILKHFPAANIVAIERSLRNVGVLNRKFGKADNVEVRAHDLFQLSLRRTSHFALWLFSGIVEFHPGERVQALRKVRDLVMPRGFLFIDISGRVSEKISTTRLKNGFIEVHYDEATLRTQLPTLRELEENCRQAGWELLITHAYQSSTDLPRYALVLRNS